MIFDSILNIKIRSIFFLDFSFLSFSFIYISKIAANYIKVKLFNYHFFLMLS